MDLANWAQSAGRIAAVTTASSLLYSGRGIESLLIGNVFSYVLVHITTIIVIRRIADIRLLRIGNLSGRCCKRLLGFGLGLFGGSVISMLLSPFNKLMLSRYAGVSTIPVYEIAYSGSMQVRALIAVGLRALMPEVSRIGANMTGYAKDRIAQLNYRAIKLILLFGLPVYAGLFVFSTFLFRIWLGERFVEALPGAFRIMLIATFASLLCVPAYYTLLGLGRVTQCFYSYAIQAGANVFVVLLAIITTRSLSVMHVVWAALIAMGMTSAYLIWQNRRAMGRLPLGAG
jgi:O-antigen/teichoic acid export membrane protein